MSAKNHTILHVLTKKEKINKIYKLAKDDLYVNGGHSILVDNLINLKLFRRYKKIGDLFKFMYLLQKIEMNIKIAI